jgi:hypothetical protein
MLLPILGAAACSTVPQREWPPFEQRSVVAEWNAASAPVELPTSREDLTVLELRIEPQGTTETFADGKRLVALPKGSTKLTVHCTYRAYARDGATLRPEDLFRGAVVRNVTP